MRRLREKGIVESAQPSCAQVEFKMCANNTKTRGVKNFTLVTRWIRFQPTRAQIEPSIRKL